LEAVFMAAVTVRNLPEATHRALKLRAAHNGRSTEAEIRVILEQAVTPNSETGLGSQLAALGRRFGGIELNITRDSRPAEPADFS
jgi:plasmid stability protein